MKQEGYNMFYECNNCQNIMYKYIDLSFIIRSAVPLYSDRRSFSTSLSLITRCKKCNIVFWLGENIQSISEENDKSKCPIESSTIYEYLEAINTNLFNTKSEEIYLRKMLWWSFNDRAREWNDRTKYINNKILEAEGDFGISIWERIRLDFIEKKAKKTCCKNDDEVIIYNENINKLIPLLDNNEIENMLMKADLNRNLGDFEECMSILNSIPGQDWIKIRFERECKNKNKNAFIIN